MCFPFLIFQCATQTNVLFDPINQCFNNEGDKLLAASENRIHTTEKAQDFVPTITYDDIFSQDLQDKSLANFAGVFYFQVAADQLVDYCDRDNTEGSSANSLTVTNGLLLFVFCLFVFFFALVNQW